MGGYKFVWFMQTLTKKGGGDIGLCDESTIYGCLIEIWYLIRLKKLWKKNYYHYLIPIDSLEL